MEYQLNDVVPPTAEALMEAKSIFEKNIKEEVAKITDEVVRGYYVQDMKEKIYQELGQGAWRKSRYSAGKNDYYCGTQALVSDGCCRSCCLYARRENSEGYDA